MENKKKLVSYDLSFNIMSEDDAQKVLDVLEVSNPQDIKTKHIYQVRLPDLVPKYPDFNPAI